jgi:hypothetical protein
MAELSESDALPSISEQEIELAAAGWQRVRKYFWKSPGGSLFIRSAAWRELKRGEASRG